jgi:hypothetical protein
VGAIRTANGVVNVSNDLSAFGSQCPPLFRIAYLPAHLDSKEESLALMIDFEYGKPVSSVEGSSLALGKIDLIVPFKAAFRPHVETGVPPHSIFEEAGTRNEMDFLIRDSRTGAIDRICDGFLGKAGYKARLRRVTGKGALRRNCKRPGIQLIEAGCQACEVAGYIHSDGKLEDSSL